jgi:hypothetical protein
MSPMRTKRSRRRGADCRTVFSGLHSVWSVECIVLILKVLSIGAVIAEHIPNGNGDSKTFPGTPTDN